MSDSLKLFIQLEDISIKKKEIVKDADFSYDLFAYWMVDAFPCMLKPRIYLYALRIWKFFFLIHPKYKKELICLILLALEVRLYLFKNF